MKSLHCIDKSGEKAQTLCRYQPLLAGAGNFSRHDGENASANEIFLVAQRQAMLMIIIRR
jgi:hypothetical protein